LPTFLLPISAKFPKAGPNLFYEQSRLLEGGKVAAAIQLIPVNDTIACASDSQPFFMMSSGIWRNIWGEGCILAGKK
jgi:hypothetical protein